ncbi:MAG: sugar phosphate isomerase/epimerase [Verrucomicrobiales bacterium]|nr:sugar phosphate isomerase/epimerase [Verrucomicrobiales bacterium]
MKTSFSRRNWIGAAGTMGLATFLRAAEESGNPVATNIYPWITFAKRTGDRFEHHSDSLMADIASTGITGYEPIINGTAEFEGLANRLKKHGLLMRSLYLNSTLHDRDKVKESIAGVLAIAAEAKDLGTEIIVTNPSPIRWGGPENKSDEQLRFQAKSLDRLGAELRKMGISLAYHNHDIELRNGAREFHHMLTSTDPDNVKFCLDAHWVFRGCGNSEVAVFDALAHYGERIVELHLRQSTSGTWNEAFSLKGDIDYSRLIGQLKEAGISPYLVLEQAVEKVTPKTMSVVEAHRRGKDALEGG